jgi:hypothetical protein
MRNLSLAIVALAPILVVSGCGAPDQGHGGGSNDMSVAVMAMPDFSLAPTKCSPTDTLNDGATCGASNTCPSGQQAVIIGGTCKCFTGCDPTQPTTCPCDRACSMLSFPDGGSGNGACLPANGPGERCFTNASGVPYGHGFCQQGYDCTPIDQAKMFRYCLYQCSGSSGVCPQQTECDVLQGLNAYVCNPIHDTMSKALGAACTPATDSCVFGALCDPTSMTCKTQCDGPNATCASGTTCQAVTDPAMRIAGYVCK